MSQLLRAKITALGAYVPPRLLTNDDLEKLVEFLQDAGLKVARAQDEPPSNVSVVGEARPVLRQPERGPGIETGVWLWGAADNLRVPSANAVAIAQKLLAS